MFLFLSLLSLIFRMAAFLRLGCLTFGPTGREGKLSRNETETEIPQCSTFFIVLISFDPTSYLKIESSHLQFL